MADWTNLPNTAVGVGGLPSGTTVTALRDNPVAIAEGAAGAPRLYLRSLEQLEAGDEIRSRNDTGGSLQSNDNDASITLHSFSFTQYGQIRVEAEKVSGTGGIRILRRRNGSVQTTLFEGTSNAVHSVDVDILPGDTVSIVLFRGLFASVSGQNARFSTNGQDLWPGVEVRLEGNRSAT